MRIYVIRHGESETNRQRTWCGWMDVSLTDSGRDDAQKAGKLLEGISFDKIYSSDLKRAVETAQIVIPHGSYETTSLLREINVGRLAGTPLGQLTDKQKEGIAQNGYAEFDGETKEEFGDRIKRVMSHLETLNCENVALFAHAGVLRGILDTVVGSYLPRKRVLCNNCTVAVFEFANGEWALHSWINL